MKKYNPSSLPISPVTQENELTEVLDHEEGRTNAQQVEEIKRKSVSGAASYMTRSLVLYGISIVATGFLAAYLTPTEFGIYGVVTQIIGLLTFFSDIGFASALIQKGKEPTTAEYRTVFTVQQLLSWLIFLVTVVLAMSGVLQPKIGWDGVLVLMGLGISFPLASLKTIPSVILERKLDFSKLVLPQILEQIVYNGIVIGCAMMGLGVRSYLYAVLARAIIGVIAMSLLQKWPFGVSIDRTALKTMLGTGVKFQLNDFISRIKDQLFYLMLGWFLPLNEFGYITFAKQWSFMPYQLTVQNVIAITFPTYARLQHDKHLLQKAIEKTIFFITLCIFPLLVGMSIFIFPFIHLVSRLGKWEPALLTFVLFTLSIGWAAISTPLTNTLNAIGSINKTLKLMVMWTLLTWILTPVGIKLFGFNGVALAAFVISFTSFLPIYYVRQIVPVRILENVWRQFAAALVMSGVGIALLPFSSQSMVHFFIGGAVTGVAYLLGLGIFARQKVHSEVTSLLKKRG
jgi:O-antigen/teichoic acid export membrane protein